MGGVQGGRGLPSAGVVPPERLVKAVLEGAGTWGRLHGLLRGKVCCRGLGLCCLGLGLLLLVLATQQLMSPPSLSLFLQVTLALLPTPVAAKLWRESGVSHGWLQQAGNGASNFVNQHMTNTSICSTSRT